ncbi:glycosyltransferase family 4 protein [Candidatus Saccharibacteria bacterium]|nr:glycosyltransferase family 4 protein [Candidatus Saccharibacteria bacterium]
MGESKKYSVGFLYDDSLDTNNGVSQYVKTVGGWLSANGHQVTYLVGESKLKTWAGGEVYSLSKNLRVAWGGNRLSVSVVPKLKLIKKIVKQKDIDVIHVQVPYSPLMAQIVISSLGPRTALVGTVHIFPSNAATVFGSKVLKVIYGKSLKRFDAMLSVSTAAQHYAADVFKIKSEIVPNAIDISKFRVARTLKPSADKEIVFLGRLVQRKGCEELLRAFEVLIKTLPSATLTIAGDGPLRQKLEKIVDNGGLRNSVKFLGYVDERDKPKILANADIACFPALGGESFGIVLIEAMAAGATIVLGGDNPGYTSVLGEKSEALVDPRDSVAFAGRLEKFLTDEDLIRRLHEYQQTQVMQYDINVVGKQLLDAYARAVASRHQKP